MVSISWTSLVRRESRSLESMEGESMSGELSQRFKVGGRGILQAPAKGQGQIIR